MHFRNFDYIFGSLIACVPDSSIFNQPEIRVRKQDVGVSGVVYGGLLSNVCNSYGCLKN